MTYIPHTFAQHAKRRLAPPAAPTVPLRVRRLVGWHFLIGYTFAFVRAVEARYLIWQVPLPWESVTKMCSHYATHSI